ncbi:erythroblast NAD(P)(+)--arginine ADP-ribosyltransferase-like [Pezoporus flaviventris]|uniref:erythroblast NAD(P)(+)--arginine ADP-ribosyltransferase-like n=1 Tax=Pezoporus flaviventris TaxID=889875 RepID=UPI002AB0AAE0|nr:erythroblast NAD(P)(+)--arginine ADP-ribosyltransferase-like [Pezoporus flaviventris]
MERLVLGLVLLAAGSPLPLSSSIQEVAMDMAPASFDDRYEGCSHLMERELPELNRTEFGTNGLYAEAWSRAAEAWRQRRVPRAAGLRPEHAVALLAYTMEGPLYAAFNAAVREAGGSRQRYLHGFPFKALHFLLSQALSTLRGAGDRGRCRRVFRGVRAVRFTARRGQSVRFGHFTSSSLRNGSSFGCDTFFTVHTCCGVPIRDFSSYPAEEEVLIPPSEVFQVTGFSRTGRGSLIQLRSQGANSTYNCELVKEKRCGSAPCSFRAAEPGPHRCGATSAGAPPGSSAAWGLLLAALAAAGRP